MYEQDIRLNWRAAIVLDNGRQVVHGRLQRLGRKKVVVCADHNLSPGYRCNLAVMLPKSRADETGIVVEASATIAASVLSAMQFYITLDRVTFEGRAQALLDERLRILGKM
ncbi:MAG TPA: hypothetical protein VFW59_08730 [Gallionella sp.]|nr:hypothetical protein [Gallionella sp.]